MNIRPLCTISAQLFAEHRVTAGSQPSYRHEEPASPNTSITLLTGGLLVRIQPEAAARLVGVLAGGSPASGTCPVATVVISGGGAGDQSAGSPDVKVPVGRVENPVSSVRGASNSTGRSDMRTVSKPRNWIPHVKRSVGVSDVPRPSSGVEGQCHRRRTGCKQPMNVPGSQRATCRDRIASESPEPLVGRLGGDTQRRHPV
jgi:hypothetical protein